MPPWVAKTGSPDRPPTQHEWRKALPNLKGRPSGELCGPCPRCGGEDRFYVRVDGGAYCRKCCPDASTAAHQAAFSEIMAKVFPGAAVRAGRGGAAAKARPPSKIKPDVEARLAALAASQAARLGGEGPPKPPAEAAPAESANKPPPSPENVPAGDSGPSTKQWTYLLANGRPHMVVHRRDDGNGGKTFRQQAVRKRSDGAAHLENRGPTHTCLYRLPEIAKASKVLIVEGEKCADAAQDALQGTGWVATTWPGGSAAGAIRKCGTWKSLGAKIAEGKMEVVVWPDNDAPGRKAALHVAGLLPGCRLVEPPTNLPKGGDVVDALAAGADVLALIEGGVEPPAGTVPPGGDGGNGAGGLTNAAAASFLAAECRGALVFAEHRNSWMELQRGVWRRCGRPPYKAAAVRGKLTAWAAKVDPDKWRKAESTNFVKASWDLVDGERGMSLPASEFDRNGNLPTPAGHIDVKTGEWRAEPDLEGNHTMSAAVDPDPDCPIPEWEATVRKVTQGDGELAGYLQRLAGLLLTEDKSNHAIYWVYGPGRNGKTTFFETLLSVMGDYAALRSAGDLTQHQGDEERFAAGLERKRVLVVSELRSGKWNTSVMKRLSGGESVAARYLYKETFEFKPRAKLVVYGNDEPAIPKGHDFGFAARIKKIPFLHNFAEDADCDPKMMEKLEREAPGILEWARQGLVALIADNMTLREPECVRQATAQYVETQDEFGQWLEECTVKDPEGETPVGELYASYEEWMKDRGHDRIPPKNWFGRTLSGRGFPNTQKRRGSASVRARKGIRLADGEGKPRGR